MTPKAAHLYLITSDGHKSPIHIAQTPLGGGADANIYQIAGQPDAVAKIYHDPAKDPLRQDKIRAMIANTPALPPIRKGRSAYIQIAWPTGTVEDRHGNFMGYTMPFVDLKRSTVLENLLAKKTRQKMGLSEFYGYRVVSAANLAALVAALHACGHHIIDLKPVNLNVYTDKFYIALLDCDGLSIRGQNGQRFNAHQYTDGYIAPEALQKRLHPQDLGEEQDRFALAVILFQLLNRGIHPYQGKPRKGVKVPPTNSERIQRRLYAYGKKPNTLLGPSPWSIHKYLEDDTRKLFDRAFGSNPSQRPSADEWKRHLHKLADPSTGLLRKCKRIASHGMFTKGCGFCHVEGLARQAASKKKIQARPKTTTPHSPGHHQPAQVIQITRPTVRRPLSRKTKTMIWCILICVVVGSFFIYRSNIHSIIRRNDQEAFFERIQKPNFDWNQLSLKDLSTAVVHEDERIFCAIVEGWDTVPFTHHVFNHLIDEKRFKAMGIYLRHVADLQCSYKKFKIIIHSERPELIDAIVKAIQKSNDEAYIYTQAFIHLDRGVMREILSRGADPNMTITIENNRRRTRRNREHTNIGMKYTFFGANKEGRMYQILDDLYAALEVVPNRCADGVTASSTVDAIRQRYNGPYKVPGVSRIRDLERSQAEIETLFSPAFQSPYGLATFRKIKYQIHPLTIAVLYSDVEATRMLIAAGAKINAGIPNHSSILNLGLTPEIYKTLKSGHKPTDLVERAIAADDPKNLAAALSEQKKRGVPVDPQRLKILATASGSIACIDMLYQRWKKKPVSDPHSPLFTAYRSGNPHMLAYYLRHVAPSERIYKYQHLAQAYGWRRYRPKSVPALLSYMQSQLNRLQDMVAREDDKISLGEFLLEVAEKERSWAMAFVLEDHISKWSDLHMAVLDEDQSQITKLLRMNPGRIEERDNRGRTPFGLAVQYNCAKSYKCLMDFNPNIDAKDKKGRTPIIYAAEYGNEALTQDLILKGAKLFTSAEEKCSRALKVALETKSAADKMTALEKRMNIVGIPGVIIDCIEKIEETHKIIESVSRHSNLAACD